MIKLTTIAVVLLFGALFAFTGCAIQTAHAAPPSPAGCNGSVCAGSSVHVWGDSSGKSCYYETHEYAHSISVSVEIPIGSNPDNTPNDAYCYIPVPFGNENITQIDGSISYDNWNTTNTASMSTRLNINGDGCNCGEDNLISHKLQVAHALSQNAPSITSMPINVKLPTSLFLQNYFVINISDDLAKPTTLHYAFSIKKG